MVKKKKTIRKRCSHGIAQQRRVSKTRKLKRRTHYKLEVPGMVVCPNCGELKLSHRVCPVCGHYSGKLVKEIKVKEDKAEKETDK